MSHPANERDASAGEQLRVDVDSKSGRISLVGASLAVIAALLTIGLVWVSIAVIGLAKHAIDQGAGKGVAEPALVHPDREVRDVK